jgi:hypothetical protein
MPPQARPDVRSAWVVMAARGGASTAPPAGNTGGWGRLPAFGRLDRWTLLATNALPDGLLAIPVQPPKST